MNVRGLAELGEFTTDALVTGAVNAGLTYFSTGGRSTVAVGGSNIPIYAVSGVTVGVSELVFRALEPAVLEPMGLDPESALGMVAPAAGVGAVAVALPMVLGKVVPSVAGDYMEYQSRGQGRAMAFGSAAVSSLVGQGVAQRFFK